MTKLSLLHPNPLIFPQEILQPLVNMTIVLMISIRYAVGQQYLPHFDYFNENDEAQRVHQIGPAGNRIATVRFFFLFLFSLLLLPHSPQRSFALIHYPQVLTCLQSPEEGGETVFPNINLNVSCITVPSFIFLSNSSTSYSISTFSPTIPFFYFLFRLLRSFIREMRYFSGTPHLIL